MGKRKIAFWDNTMSERGTTVAVYDYAYYNRYLLGNESIVLYNQTMPQNQQSVIARFEKEFTLFGVSRFQEVDEILINQKCDILYVITSGENDGHISRVVKTVVHCVFNTNAPRGDVYAAISPCLHGYKETNPIVPHMINLPQHDENLRERLGIPLNATVFGRYGGKEQFDIPYVQQTVYDIAQTHSHIFFIFMNTRSFCPPLNNIIHLQCSTDLHEKVAFINTCDAMLWARRDGESFGLSIGEFSTCNKPVFCTKDPRDLRDNAHLSHVHLLSDKGCWYTRETLRDMLMTFSRNDAATKDWNAFRDYTPEKVMACFKKIFIDSLRFEPCKN